VSQESSERKRAEDLRKQYRHPVHWRVAIIHDNVGKNEIYHGQTHDLSTSGASIFVDQNIFLSAEVIMLLAVPPVNAGQRETIIEIHCNMAYTVLDSEHSRFRIGIRFLHFKRNGKQLLEDILSKRMIPQQHIE
jgi:hypothetical protein